MFRKYHITLIISLIVASIFFIFITKDINKNYNQKRIKINPSKEVSKINSYKTKNKCFELSSESDNKVFNPNNLRKKLSYMRIIKYPHYKNKNKFRICFGSCNINPKNRSVWQNISSYQPDLWLFLGDNYYNDIDLEEEKGLYHDEDILTNHFRMINKMKYNPSFQKFLKEHKYLAIWDDHDYYRNNEDFNINPELQTLFRRSFLDFFKIPTEDIRYKRKGIYTYHDLVIKGVNVIRFFLLDVRTTKSNLDILGKDQWRWLEENLKLSPANLNFIVSGTAFLADTNPKINFESWEKTGWSFKKLEELLNVLNMQNIVLISGDLHIGRTMVRNHLIEFTSSSLTSRPWEKNITSHIDPPLNENNFGFIDIDYSDINNPSFTGGLINLHNGKHSNLLRFEAK